MRLVLVGPPGSGKGTQAKLLVERQGLEYIGTGDLLRDAIRRGTPLGLAVEPFLRNGQLAPDRLVNELVSDKFRSEGRPEGFVLDGYPRTRAQAVWFDAELPNLGLTIDAVINLLIDDEEVVRRIGSRWICPDPTCGRSYNVAVRPPKVAGVCDACGRPLVQRVDDQESTVRKRLAVFHAVTDDLVDYYRRSGALREFSALAPAEQIYATILQAARPDGGGERC